MTNAFEEFKRWYRASFDVEYDPADLKAVSLFKVFEAGWDARENLS